MNTYRSSQPDRRKCDICGCDKIITRRVTRTTQACPHTADQTHKDERARLRFAAQTARIETAMTGDSRREITDAARRGMTVRVMRATTVRPAGPFGGNSQSGRTAQHGTQSGYVMHRRHGQAACQPCKDAHAAYVRRPVPIKLDGCTCGGIGGTGAHAASCPWHS